MKPPVQPTELHPVKEDPEDRFEKPKDSISKQTDSIEKTKDRFTKPADRFTWLKNVVALPGETF